MITINEWIITHDFDHGMCTRCFYHEDFETPDQIPQAIVDKMLAECVRVVTYHRGE